MKKVAFITGITGQDGSYLAEFLLAKGYEVHGLVRRTSTFDNWKRIEHLRGKIITHYGDMTDPFSLLWALKKCNPDEVYNLAAQSHVQVSWETPLYTAQTSGIGVLNLLESIRVLGIKPRIYQASTSELFSGRPGESPQNEDTVKDPMSPYGTAKLYAFQTCVNYRDAFKMHVSNGIMFNHESARRGDNFITKKIVNAFKTGADLHIGNTSPKRDWGYAREYVEAMWLMLQKDKPGDYVIATGEAHSVAEFLKWAHDLTGRDINIFTDEAAFNRPNEVFDLCGDASKAKKELGWEAKIRGADLARKMFLPDAHD